MSKLTYFLCTALMFLFVSHSVYATPYTFEMGTESRIDVSDTKNGLVMWANIYNSVQFESFALNEGESFTFDYARMGTKESWVNNDDLTPQTVKAYLDFDAPDLTQNINGQTVGFFDSLWIFDDFYQGWSLTWEDPAYVDFGDGGRYSIRLSDANFKSGWWSGPDGLCGNAYADISATVTLETAPVPEPASILLLGIGLIGFTGVSRKKNRKPSL